MYIGIKTSSYNLSESTLSPVYCCLEVTDLPLNADVFRILSL